MKAVRFHDYGGPEVLVLEDAPRPDMAADDVLIRVHAAAVNPVDGAVRAGYFRNFMPVPLPYTPGLDVSGIVEAVGRDVQNPAVGDGVMAYASLGRPGTYAEYVAVKAAQVARKPQTVDYVSAAAIPVAALSAWQGLFDAGKLQAGQTVLIHGAAGGIGTFAVQLAKWKGAHVIGTASARNVDFLRQLGADEVVDYTARRFEDTVREVDVVLVCVGGDVQARSYGVLKPGGTLATLVGQPDEAAAKARGVHAVGVRTRPDAAQMAEIAGLVDAGQVKPVVPTVLPLSEARQAHEQIASGHTRGKIALRVVG